MRHRSGWIVCLCLCACLLLAGTAGAADTSGGAVSRGAFVDALYDAHVAHGGTPVVSEGSAAPFRDVGSWSPYFEALCWAKASGIANGYSGGTFRPDAPVSRAEAVKILNHALDRRAGERPASLPFTDVPKDHWAYDEIREAAVSHTYQKTDDGEKWLTYDR